MGLGWLSIATMKEKAELQSSSCMDKRKTTIEAVSDSSLSSVLLSLSHTHLFYCGTKGHVCSRELSAMMGCLEQPSKHSGANLCRSYFARFLCQREVNGALPLVGTDPLRAAEAVRIHTHLCPTSELHMPLPVCDRGTPG